MAPWYRPRESYASHRHGGSGFSRQAARLSFSQAGYCTIIDVMEKDGLDSGEIIELALEGLHLGIAVLNGQGRILSWNGEMARHSGILPEKALSRVFWEVYPGFFGAHEPLP